MYTLMLIFFLSALLLVLFFLISKNSNWDLNMGSIFECGFTSYFFSRFSFSIHYFLISLIFLFLDLELCTLMPFLLEIVNDSKININMILLVSILLWGLMEEWLEGKLEWSY